MSRKNTRGLRPCLLSHELSTGVKAMKKLIAILFCLMLVPSIALAANVTFTWDSYTGTATEFRLYRSDTSGKYIYGMSSRNYIASFSPIRRRSAHDMNVPSGTWYWVLTVYDSATRLESRPSNEVTTTIGPSAPH